MARLYDVDLRQILRGIRNSIQPVGASFRLLEAFYRPLSRVKDEHMATEKSQDAIALLKADHRKVADLFEQFESASGDGKKQKIALQICLELTVHAKIKVEIFYPACEGKIEEDLLKEAYVEHDGAKVLIAEIEAGGPDDEYYEAKVKVLSEQIEHHVGEEEQRMEAMFAQARKAGLGREPINVAVARVAR